jgi:CheY-like chemotaxis protein
VGHGTGLGLSQVYGFVKQSGGHVKIYSEVDSGTTVKMYLPRLYAEEPSAAAESAPRIAMGSAKEVILAVEDDTDVRAQTTGALRELGYRVLEAGNGKAALELLEANPHVDLLFTDVGLPGGMNGRQLAEAARSSRHRLKVLFTTGYARNAIMHEGRLEPGVQLITKPFTFAALSQKLRDMLDLNSAATRILIVEDEELVQIVLAAHVEELGFEVEIAATAAEAKNKMLLLNGSIDAAIIDMGLPDARGDGLVIELRATYPTLPIVVSSGYDKAALQGKLAAAHNIEFLSKPYTQAELREALSRVGIAQQPV